ncbi:MAG: FemAB family PEP-CTERM system-associated protein [Gammaproteobacteria bacterium]|nr:FemAB family PEP-CTERM system-associated protein [Gammaproteobacteria bacterium]
MRDPLDRRWDDFVAASADATHYHRSGWRDIIRDVFGHQSYYLYAVDASDHFVGVLPLMLVKSLLFGSHLVSMPFLNSGGILASSDESAAALSEQARRLALDCSVDNLQLRERQGRAGFSAQTDKITMILDLPASEEMLWAGLGSKLRAQVRRCQREDVRFASGGSELVQDFYMVFSQNMRDLGTPVYPRRFFQRIIEAFPDEVTIMVVYLAGKPVAAAFLLAYKDTLEIPWASTLRSANKYSVNMYLYWNVITHAIKNGYAHFDFGRCSRDKGTYQFKKQWDTREVQLVWNNYGKNGDQHSRVSAENSKYSLLISAWQRLPLPVANILGPWIIKGVP